MNKNIEIVKINTQTGRYILLTALFIMSTVYHGCEKKNVFDAPPLESQQKRIIYFWDLAPNSACFLLQGKRVSGHARFIRLTPSLYSVRIYPQLMSELPLLKFTLRDIQLGKKRAPAADVSYQDSDSLYTNFDYAGASFLEIFQADTELRGKFAFRIRNREGQWLYFTQGEFFITLKK